MHYLQHISCLVTKDKWVLLQGRESDQKWIPHRPSFSLSENDAGRVEAEHEHLLFYCVLKWLLSRKVMNTRSGLR